MNNDTDIAARLGLSPGHVAVPIDAFNSKVHDVFHLMLHSHKDARAGKVCKVRVGGGVMIQQEMLMGKEIMNNEFMIDGPSR